MSSVDQFEHLSAYRDHLRELLATNNPFFIAFTPAPGAPPQSPSQLDYSIYQQYISSIFPSLKLLDAVPIQSFVDFDLPSSLLTTSQTSLPEAKGSCFDSEDSQKRGEAFVKLYFSLYDTNRQSRDLISVYGDNAIFSLSYQPEPKFPNSKYTEQNRNIASLGSAKVRAASEVSLLKTSPVAIVNTLVNLPNSKHDPNTFIADVVKMSNGLLNITVKGEFVEGETIGGRGHKRVERE